MKTFLRNYLWSLLILWHSGSIHGLCPITKPQCPIGYELKNEWCYYVGPEMACPPDYEKRDGLCYLQQVTDCYMPEISTTPSLAATATATTTTSNNKETEQDRCPKDAIFVNEKCRKIICSLGEYYNGRCLQPACPPGLVWFSKRCQKPAYSITILEIDNNIINDKRNHPYAIIQNTTNSLRHDAINDTTTSTSTSTSTSTTASTSATSILTPTQKSKSTSAPSASASAASASAAAAAALATTKPILTDPTAITSKSINNNKMLPFEQIYATTNKPTITRAQTTTVRTTFQRSHIYNESIADNHPKNCCVIVTPRICKVYGLKWVCFNRRQHLCDDRVCVARTVYLKAPEINYKYPLLIMPPNPSLKSCLKPNCSTIDTNEDADMEANTKIDCSGCIDGQRQHCSSYCYHYICPQGACTYVNLEEYCNYYPRQFGCLEQDGCIWNWC